MALVHIYIHLLCYCTNMLTFWLSMLLLSFLIFMSNVSIINVFYHIFVSEVIFKTRIIKTKRTRTTFLNLTLLPSCNYLRGFILFDNNASWHWTMTCRNWEFQWVLLISSCKDWIKSLQYFLCNCYVCMCVSINPFVYFKCQYYFTFLACFFCFHFFTFCFGTPNTQPILFQDKYFALLYWTISYIYQKIWYVCMLILPALSMFCTLCTFCISFYFSMEI